MLIAYFYELARKCGILFHRILCDFASLTQSRKLFMTDTQKKLLELTDEIAQICDANGIVYYLAGGTTIGVLRHRGFIPWDDDMDIMMTRDNWDKFLAATKDNLPPGRALMCQENSRSYNNMFGRYVDTTSSTIHRGDILGGGAAGFVIDILCLDPVPSKEAHREYIRDLMLYSDLINPLMNYSIRWNVNQDRYQEYLDRIKVEGRDAVLSELEQAMFSYKEEECNYLVLRWGGVPFLFEKSMYGSSRWGEFEGKQYRIMDRAGDYLVQHYGDEWAYIPPHDEQIIHDAIFSPEIGYGAIQDDYLPLLDIEKEREFFFNEKLNYFKNKQGTNNQYEFAGELIALTSQYALEKKVADSGVDVDALLDAGEYAKILDLFSDYIKEQGSRDLIGREDFTGIHLFNEPRLVDIPENWFYAVIVSMVNCNKMSKAMRFMDVWEQVRGSLSERLKEQREKVLKIRKAVSLYDTGDVTAAVAATKELYSEYPDNQSVAMLLVTLLAKSENYDELKTVLDAVITQYPHDGYILKFLGDYYRHQGDTAKAHETYVEALANTRNGMTMLELGDLAQQDKNYSDLQGLIKI